MFFGDSQNDYILTDIEQLYAMAENTLRTFFPVEFNEQTLREYQTDDATSGQIRFEF